MFTIYLALHTVPLVAMAYFYHVRARARTGVEHACMCQQMAVNGLNGSINQRTHAHTYPLAPHMLTGVLASLLTSDKRHSFLVSKLVRPLLPSKNLREVERSPGTSRTKSFSAAVAASSAHISDKTFMTSLRSLCIPTASSCAFIQSLPIAVKRERRLPGADNISGIRPKLSLANGLAPRLRSSRMTARRE